MKNKNYLLPHIFQRIGWLLLACVIAFGIFTSIRNSGNNKDFTINVKYWHYSGMILSKSNSGFTCEKENVTFTLIIVLGLAALTCIALSKEKTEDEGIAHVREIALVRSLWITTAISVLAAILIYGIPYLYVMFFFLFAYMLIYIIVFRIAMVNFNKTCHEE
ncbi:MAG TPA: hypothetical protein PKL23_07225 [Candidatus Egerieousia sp.]|nr:hypothetical protein [Candidatus Egerieousia sp.]